MRIRHVLVAGTAAASLALLPTAASAAQTEPGTPGDRNCEGQTTAFLAQLAGPNGDLSFLGAPGIGNLADLADLSVKEVKEIVRDFCQA